jgi:molecular chaperone GrpE (heat shock protein)
MTFLVETPETKKLDEIFCEAFSIFKTKSVSVMQIISVFQNGAL